MPAVVVSGPAPLCRTRRFVLSGSCNQYASSHFAYPWKDGQAKLGWVATSNTGTIWTLTCELSDGY